MTKTFPLKEIMRRAWDEETRRFYEENNLEIGCDKKI